MSSNVQAVSARWIIPIIPEKKILENYTLILDNDSIIDLLPRDMAMNKYSGVDFEEFKTHVLMPGLINTHTHLAMNLFKGMADDLELEDWLQNYIWPAESATLSHKMVEDGTTLALFESIQSGVTCVNDHYFFSEAVSNAVMNAGIRARISHCIFSFLLPWIDDVETYFEQSNKLINDYKSNPYIYPCLGPHAPYTTDDEIMDKVTKLSLEHDIPVHIHLHETKKEVDDFTKDKGKSPVAYFHEKNWLHDNFIAVHMTQMTEAEAEMLSQNNVSIAHCPESNMKLSSGAFNWELANKYNINVSLGTDGAASNNDLDLLGESKSASFLAKLQFGPKSLNVFEALEMLTINGAKALKLEDEIGSLEIGKKADFIAINMDSLDCAPIYNIASQVIFSTTRNQITDSWVNGKRIMKDRNVLTLKEKQIRDQTQKWKKKIIDSINQK